MKTVNLLGVSLLTMHIGPGVRLSVSEAVFSGKEWRPIGLLQPPETCTSSKGCCWIEGMRQATHC